MTYIFLNIFVYIYHIYIQYIEYWDVVILILSVVRDLHQNMMVLVVIDGDFQGNTSNPDAKPLCFHTNLTK